MLKGEAEIEDAIADCDVDGLSIMPCGARPTNPSELLISTRLCTNYLKCFEKKFDYIIMDTPPMLAVTDPCAVAARADGVILTMRIKKNIKLSASRAKEILDSVNAPILGIVVNGAGMVQGNYSNSGSYGYGYGWLWFWLFKLVLQFMDTTMASRLTTTTKTTNQWPKAKSSPSASHKRLRSFEISWHKLNPQHIV